MKQSRFWLTAILLWFFFLYNIERLSAPINIASFVYVFTIVCAVLVVLVPPLHRLAFYWPTMFVLPPFFILKSVLGYQIGGSNLPITVTEICAIGISIFLAEQIVRRIDELKYVVTSLTIDPMLKGSYSFENGQGQIYREIRRARNFQRPASLLAISFQKESLNVSLNRFIQEAQEGAIKEYVLARLARILIEELQDTDIVAQRNEHFVALLPETNKEDVSQIIRRLEISARDRLGVELNIGASSFPEEAITFEMLLERAETEMKRSVLHKDESVESTSTTTKVKSILQL
jgi:GGDEF domain-containing protein